LRLHRVEPEIEDAIGRVFQVVAAAAKAQLVIRIGERTSPDGERERWPVPTRFER
jgi:hypothetical protein